MNIKHIIFCIFILLLVISLYPKCTYLPIQDINFKQNNLINKTKNIPKPSPSTIFDKNNFDVHHKIRQLKQKELKYSLDKSICFKGKCDLCPIGTFKQCTNNDKINAINNLCQCNSNLELCPYYNKLNINESKKKLCRIYPENYPRVNFWNTIPTNSVLNNGI
tara:strand:- start:64 stop:552 length:489 start_codon:yes stop_codon:yes gene_type:complete